MPNFDLDAITQTLSGAPGAKDFDAFANTLENKGGDFNRDMPYVAPENVAGLSGYSRVVEVNPNAYPQAFVKP